MENSDLNGAVVELNAYALSDQVATLPFFANTAGNPAMSTLFPSPDGSYGMQINVATTTAAEVVRSGRAPLPTAIILDAEGAEAAILRGFGAIVSHPGLRVIVFEAAADLLAGPRASEVLDILRAAGFGIEPLVRRERTGHSLANFAARKA
jgi:FkbM family methyltransferase